MAKATNRPARYRAAAKRPATADRDSTPGLRPRRTPVIRGEGRPAAAKQGTRATQPPRSAPAKSRAAATRRLYRRRRRAVALVFFVLAILLVVVGHLVGKDEKRLSRPAVVPAASALPVGVTAPPRVVPAARNSPAVFADTAFTFASGFGPMLGTVGTIRRFKVAVQNGIGQGDGAGFAIEVDRILGDPRSWIAGRQFRLQRVPQAAAAEFIVYLASADTSEKMCAQGGLRTDGFTSCRLPGRVIINVDRWRAAVPGYGKPLDAYRVYAINHEVGHQLGHGHEACPGEGRPAPVMMQQTYGLKGCVAYSWPYLDGRRYSGTPVA